LLALNALRLKEERESLLKFIEQEMAAIAPNFSKIAGPLLAARLLAEACSLKRLAVLPSSTIQLLGAEKALFRHLRNRQAKPPKYGLIYTNAFVQKTPRKNRGKMARALAGKLSIAIREDYFGKKDISKALLQGLEKRLCALKS
jgi:nucleolar protein 56